MPVRYVPGQGSAMHHTGRQVVMVVLRTILLGVVVGFGTIVAWLVWWLGGELGFGENLRLWVAGASVVPLFAGVLVATVAFGGWTLRRFDVSRLASLT
jgi:hypothetical protein